MKPEIDCNILINTLSGFTKLHKVLETAYQRNNSQDIIDSISFVRFYYNEVATAVLSNSKVDEFLTPIIKTEISKSLALIKPPIKKEKNNFREEAESGLEEVKEVPSEYEEVKVSKEVK